MTDTSKPGQGVIDAAFSPDGKTVAVAQLGKDGRSELLFAKPDDLLLSRRQAAGRAGVQGDLAAGRLRARRRAGR